MKQYRHTGNIKAGLFILGIILISSLLIYTQSLVNRLRVDSRQIVTLYAEIIANTVSQPDDSNLDFVFENIIQKVQFPIIQTSLDGEPQSWRNLPDHVLSNKDRNKFLVKMDAQTSPIPLEFVDINSKNKIILLVSNLDRFFQVRLHSSVRVFIPSETLCSYPSPYLADRTRGL